MLTLSNMRYLAMPFVGVAGWGLRAALAGPTLVLLLGRFAVEDRGVLGGISPRPPPIKDAAGRVYPYSLSLLDLPWVWTHDTRAWSTMHTRPSLTSVVQTAVALLMWIFSAAWTGRLLDLSPLGAKHLAWGVATWLICALLTEAELVRYNYVLWAIHTQYLNSVAWIKHSGWRQAETQAYALEDATLSAPPPRPFARL